MRVLKVLCSDVIPMGGGTRLLWGIQVDKPAGSLGRRFDGYSFDERILLMDFFCCDDRGSTVAHHVRGSHGAVSFIDYLGAPNVALPGDVLVRMEDKRYTYATPSGQGLGLISFCLGTVTVEETGLKRIYRTWDIEQNWKNYKDK